MIIDLNKIGSDPFESKEFDVCICGAGVAGITLALKLSKKLKIVLLEAGGYEFSKQSQAVYEGRITGREYFDLARTRLRFFGGTSNHWTGQSSPLDSHDFEPKPYVEFSEWPLRRRDLDPYLADANAILDISKEREQEQGVSQERLTIENDIEYSGNFRSVEFRSSTTRFGHKYKNQLQRMPNLACFLNANVVDMELRDGLHNIKYVKVRNYTGTEFKVSAKIFVLATGGIENPRLLLNFNHQLKDGIGNEAGLVGRFFTEHLYHRVGEYILEDGVNVPKSHYFAPSREFMNREEILNFSLIIRPRTPNTVSFKQKLKDII